MSQAGVLAVTASPSVPTTFVTNSGNAVPVANTLNILATDATTNNDNGILTTGAGSTVTIVLSNRQTSGTITTTDATLTTALTFALSGTPGVYFIDGNITAFNVTDTAGGVYNFASGVRSDGATATEIGVEFKDSFEEAAMATSDVFVTTSGNNSIIQVQGIAGKTINWNVVLNYRFVS